MKPITVHEVLHDTAALGATGDGTQIYRTRNAADAQRFAVAHTVYGRPAKVSTVEVTRRLAQRWGLA